MLLSNREAPLAMCWSQVVFFQQGGAFASEAVVHEAAVWKVPGEVQAGTYLTGGQWLLNPLLLGSPASLLICQQSYLLTL